MHDYTVLQVHEDRMREMTRKADAYRLAVNAKEGRTRRDRRPILPRWLSFGLSRLHSNFGNPPEPRSLVAHR